MSTYYYIHNSGKDGALLFDDTWDYARFVFSLLYFNTEVSRGKMGNVRHYMKPGYRGSASVVPEGEKLVDICAFSLMPDSFHLIMRQRQDKGISRFMQKLGTGYGMHVNAKRGTKGSVFEGTYKRQTVEPGEHLLEMSRYVHMLPTALIPPLSEGRNSDSPPFKGEGEGVSERGRNEESAISLLSDYPWSSYLDYIGKRNTALLDIPSEIFLLLGEKGISYEAYCEDSRSLPGFSQ